MGAAPSDQLAMNFLRAVLDAWADQGPPRHEVREQEASLIPALAYMCLKSLTVDLREKNRGGGLLDEEIEGELRDGSGSISQSGMSLNTAMNKVIHGRLQSIEVDVNGAVFLVMESHDYRRTQQCWKFARFSATAALDRLERGLHKHRSASATEREKAIAATIRSLDLIAVAGLRSNHPGGA